MRFESEKEFYNFRNLKSQNEWKSGEKVQSVIESESETNSEITVFRMMLIILMMDGKKNHLRIENCSSEFSSILTPRKSNSK